MFLPGNWTWHDLNHQFFLPKMELSKSEQWSQDNQYPVCWYIWKYNDIWVVFSQKKYCVFVHHVHHMCVTVWLYEIVCSCTSTPVSVKMSKLPLFLANGIVILSQVIWYGMYSLFYQAHPCCLFYQAYPLPKFNTSPLKLNGWETTFLLGPWKVDGTVTMYWFISSALY